MNRSFLVFSSLLIASCIISCTIKENTNDNTSVGDSTTFDAVLPEEVMGDDFGQYIQGDFDGDGNIETAVVKKIATGEIQSKPWIYTIEFSNPNLPPFSFDAPNETPELFIEGNLNNFPGDELSVYTSGYIMNHAYLQTYTFYKGVWGKAMEKLGTQTVVYRQSLPVGLDSLSAQQLVFKEDNTVYYYEYVEPEDPSTGGDSFYQKTKAKLYAAIKPLEHVFNVDTDIVDDFDGNGSHEMGWIKIDEEGSQEEQKPWTCAVEFSDKSIRPLEFSSDRYEGRIVFEGDVNNNVGGEISVVTGTNMQNYNYLTTYTYKDGAWKKIMDEVMIMDIIPEGLDFGDIVFKENGEVYYYDYESMQTYADTNRKESLKKVKAELLKL